MTRTLRIVGFRCDDCGDHKLTHAPPPSTCRECRDAGEQVGLGEWSDD